MNATPNGPVTVLALDTSDDMLCCAVARLSGLAAGASVEVLAAADHPCRRRSNQELVTTAQQALADAGLAMADMDAVLVGRGPGSFTGVRIGISCAKGISCGLSAPLYGGSTLDSFAWHSWCAGVRGKVAVVADAMRGEVYPGVYVLDDEGARRTFARETVVRAQDCVDELSRRDDASELVVLGDGLRKYRALFEDAGLSVCEDEGLWWPSGEGLARAFAASGTQGQTVDPALVLPIYTRLSDAEENERRRLGLATPASATVTGVYEGLAGTDLQLRPMSVNDLEQVAALEASAFEGSAHTPWSRDAFYDDVTRDGRSWWVAHDRGTIVGFAGGVVAGEGMDVADVAVDASRRREHIASRLLARVAYDAQMLGLSFLTLEVDADNEPGLSLYGRLGFDEVGRRRDYYGRGHDAIVMRASLPLATDDILSGRLPEPRASIRPWPIVPAERDERQREALVAQGRLVLAFESSCDETAAAVLAEDGTVLSSVVATQIDFHARFGGVVPEIASRKHTEAIVGVYEEAMQRAGQALGLDTLAPSDLAAVAVTAGPGLVGALVVGVAFAKGLCAAADLPLLPINHLEGHLYANLFETPDLEPPFVASLVSGGNTMLVHVRDWGDYEILGTTIDDAVGEAFDKVAKALGLGYPGGPVISKLAAQGNPRAIAFPRAMLHSHDYRFSLSGLKTAVVTYIQAENNAGRPVNVPDLCASFQAAVVDVLVAKAATAVDECGVSDFCAGGGVAANPALRAEYQRKMERRGVRVTVPPLDVCGDNAAMIGLVACTKLRQQAFADFTLDANPNLPL